MLGILDKAGLRPITPAGAYYVMTDSSALGLGDDMASAIGLVREARVAAVPGSSFYSRPELGRSKLRFSFQQEAGHPRRGGQAPVLARGELGGLMP